MAIRNVVFDLGGVLIEWDPRRLYRTIFADERAMERFLAEICSLEWNGQQDLGRSWAEAVETLTAVHPEFRNEIAAYRERWLEMLGGPIQPTVDLLADLRVRGTRLFALSNWSSETFEISRRLPEYSFLDWFDGIVISGEERLAKPDPRIFQRLLDRHGLKADETLFVDDVGANVEAARAIGINAVRFEDAAQLRDEMRRIGLLDRVDTPAPSAPPGSMG